MIFRTLPLAAIALFALSACNNNSQKPVEVTSVADDPQAAAVHNRPMAELFSNEERRRSKEELLKKIENEVKAKLGLPVKGAVPELKDSAAAGKAAK